MNQRAPEKNDFPLELNKKHSPGNNAHALHVTCAAYLILSNLFGYDCILCRGRVMRSSLAYLFLSPLLFPVIIRRTASLSMGLSGWRVEEECQNTNFNQIRRVSSTDLLSNRGTVVNANTL